jgi:Tol biopolymer transport system component
MTPFAHARAAIVLLIMLVASLLTACGEPDEITEPAVQPRAAASPGTDGASPTRSGIPTPATTPASTVAPSTSANVPSAPIVVPLDPDGGEQYRLYIIDTDGAPPRRLTPEDSEIIGAESAPVWSPDGKQLVFVGYVGDGVDLFTIDADGTGLRNITNIARHTTQPSWSPDGRQITYVRTDADSQDIHLVNADGSDNHQLTGGLEHEFNPVWSPDGEWIAFLRTVFVETASSEPDRAATEAAEDDDSAADSQAADGDFQTMICLMRPDGSDERVLATVHFAEGLQWSPDGQQLAFSTYGNFRENEHAQVVNVGGSGQHAFDNGTVESSLPNWSPDGSQLSAVVTDPGGSTASIVVMNADGSDARPIADLAGWHAWSPDGSQLLVAQGRITTDATATGRSNLYLISLSAPDQTPLLLLEDAAIGSTPAWQRVP